MFNCVITELAKFSKTDKALILDSGKLEMNKSVIVVGLFKSFPTSISNTIIEGINDVTLDF